MTADAVALALAFHRAPVRHPDLLHARTPLPAGVDVLLKLAGGSRPGLECAALAPPDELQAAALFFVEQVLLHHDADHYRVLGLEPGATAEQIKEHHRLLMRLFHPDRERHDGDWKDAFATRINLAYTTLHEPASRRGYDAGLRAAGASTHATSRRTVRARPARRPGLPPWLARHLPQWVLAGTALVALAVVGAVYVNNPRPAARLAAAPLPPEPTSPAADPLPAAAPQPPVATPAVPAMPRSAANPVAAAAPLAPPPAAASTLTDPAPPAAAPAPAAAPPATPAERTAAVAEPTPAAHRVAPATPPKPPAVLPEPPAAALPIVNPPRPPAAAPAAAPAKADPNATLARFAATYERGDTAGLMALFDEVAIGNAGGKPQIRRAHEALFRSTDLRRVDFENMTWAQEGDLLHGRGRYQATRMRKGELMLETESGVVRIDLLRRGSEALIMALDYQPGERS